MPIAKIFVLQRIGFSPTFSGAFRWLFLENALEILLLIPPRLSAEGDRDERARFGVWIAGGPRGLLRRAGAGAERCGYPRADRKIRPGQFRRILRAAGAAERRDQRGGHSPECGLA